MPRSSSPPPDSLAALLLQLRERRGWTQEKVSVKAGQSTTYYGKIEQNKRRPSQHALHAILRALDPSTDERATALHRWALGRVPADLLLDSDLHQGSGLTTDPRRLEPEMKDASFTATWRRVRVIYWQRKAKPGPWNMLQAVLGEAVKDIDLEEREYRAALRNKRIGKASASQAR